MPKEQNTFHCGGNDAYYAMQAFLALLLCRAGSTDFQPDHKVFQHLRELAWAKAPLKREMRDRMDEEDAKKGDLEDFDGLGDMFARNEMLGEASA